MKINSQELLDNLREITFDIIAEVEEFKLLDISKLNNKVDVNSWSALECFEHLNRYGRFYIPEMQNRIRSANKKANSIFVSGWLGNYFAMSMIPSDKMKPIKTFASMNPIGSQLKVSVLDEFITQQNQIIEILESARQINLTKIKTAISISKLIKLRLGDTLRVVIYHNQRHLVQAKRALTSELN